MDRADPTLLDLPTLRAHALAAGVSPDLASHLDREALLEELRGRAAAPRSMSGSSSSFLSPLTPSVTPPVSEPWTMLDLQEPPETYDELACEAMPRDPRWLFVYWEAPERDVAQARQQLGSPEARLTLRLFVLVSAPDGIKRQLRDVEPGWGHGRRYLEIGRPGAQVRVALGVRSPEGLFAPLCESQAVRMPWSEAGPPTHDNQWMEVRLDGKGGRPRLLSWPRGFTRGTIKIGSALPDWLRHLGVETNPTSRGTW